MDGVGHFGQQPQDHFGGNGNEGRRAEPRKSGFVQKNYYRDPECLHELNLPPGFEAQKLRYDVQEAFVVDESAAVLVLQAAQKGKWTHYLPLQGAKGQIGALNGLQKTAEGCAGFFTHPEERIVDLERSLVESKVSFIKKKDLLIEFRRIGPHKLPALFGYKARQTLDILCHHLLGGICGQLGPDGYLRRSLKHKSDCPFPIPLRHTADESGAPKSLEVLQCAAPFYRGYRISRMNRCWSKLSNQG